MDSKPFYRSPIKLTLFIICLIVLLLFDHYHFFDPIYRAIFLPHICYDSSIHILKNERGGYNRWINHIIAPDDSMIKKLDSNFYLYESNIHKINFYNCFKSKSGKYGLKTKFVGTEGQIRFWYLITIDGKLTDVYDCSGEFDFVSRPVRKSHPSNIRIGLLSENSVFSDGIPDPTKLSKVVIVILVDNEHEFY